MEYLFVKFYDFATPRSYRTLLLNTVGAQVVLNIFGEIAHALKTPYYVSVLRAFDSIGKGFFFF